MGGVGAGIIPGPLHTGAKSSGSVNATATTIFQYVSTVPKSATDTPYNSLDSPGCTADQSRAGRHPGKSVCSQYPTSSLPPSRRMVYFDLSNAERIRLWRDSLLGKPFGLYAAFPILSLQRFDLPFDTMLWRVVHYYRCLTLLIGTGPGLPLPFSSQFGTSILTFPSLQVLISHHNSCLRSTALYVLDRDRCRSILTVSLLIISKLYYPV